MQDESYLGMADLSVIRRRRFKRSDITKTDLLMSKKLLRHKRQITVPLAPAIVLGGVGIPALAVLAGLALVAKKSPGTTESEDIHYHHQPTYSSSSSISSYAPSPSYGNADAYEGTPSSYGPPSSSTGHNAGYTAGGPPDHVPSSSSSGGGGTLGGDLDPIYVVFPPEGRAPPNETQPDQPGGGRSPTPDPVNFPGSVRSLMITPVGTRPVSLFPPFVKPRSFPTNSVMWTENDQESIKKFLEDQESGGGGNSFRRRRRREANRLRRMRERSTNTYKN